MTPSSCLCLGSIGAAVLLSVSGARAQSEDPNVLATAQAMYLQAVKAMDRRDYAAACPQLEEVVRLVPEGFGAKLTLGECYQAEERFASAWTMYNLIESGAVKPDQVRHRDAARKHLAEIEARLSYLTVVVSGAVRSLAGLEIRRDGTSMGPAQWGISLPVDRGKHVVVATATGKRRSEVPVNVDRDGARLSVEIKDLEDAPPSAEPSASPPMPRPGSALPPVPAPRQGSIVPAAVSFGVGVVGIGVGAVTGAMALAKVNDIKSRCVDSHCLVSDRGAGDTAHTLGVVSTIGFVVGGAAAAAGTILLILRPGREGPRDGVAVSAGLGLGQIVVRGGFR
jgi:hypothetical protein